MRNNIRGIDGTPIQRVRRTAPTEHSELFTDKELRHITKPPTPLTVALKTSLSAVAKFVKKHYRPFIRNVGNYTKLGLSIFLKNSKKMPSHICVLFSKKTRRKSLLLLVCIIVIGTIFFSLMKRSPAPAQPASQSYSQAAKNTLPKGTPEFATITPQGIQPSGGWTRVSPKTSDAVYAYADTIDSIRIIVSQQPLPKDFKTDTKNKIQELAIGYSAGEHLTIDSTDVYIGKSSSGQQSVVTTKNNLLILIKTNSAIDHGKLLNYIQSLR